MSILKSLSSFEHDENAYNEALQSYNDVCEFCHKKLLKAWSDSDVLNPSEDLKFMIFRTKQKFIEAKKELKKAEKAYKRWF